MGLNTIPANAWPPSSDQMGSGGGGSQYVLPIAGAETLGGVKVGDGLSINAETGKLSNDNPTPYSLPIAGAETLGGVKVGTGLSIDAETGELSANSTLVNYSTAEQNTGVKWIDGNDIYSKTIDIGTLPENNYKDTNHGVSGIDTVVKVELMAKHVSSGITLVQSGIFYANYVDNTVIRVTTTFAAADYSAKATIFYTKSS